MESVHAQLANVSRDISKDICQNETVSNFVKNVAPDLAGGVVNIATQNEKLSEAAKVAVGAIAESRGKEVSEFVVALGVSVAISAASILVIPGAIGYGIYSVLKRSLK